MSVDLRVQVGLEQASGPGWLQGPTANRSWPGFRWVAAIAIISVSAWPSPLVVAWGRRVPS